MKKLLVSLLLTGLMSSNSLMAFEPFVVQEIKIEGLQRISRESVLQDLPITLGEQLTEEKSTAAIHALFESGFYKNIELERDGSTLIVKLVERPSIGKLELKGLKDKEEVEKILKQNNVAEGRMYDPSVITRVEQEIIHHYLTQQRYSVRVDTKVTPDDRNRVSLVIHVYEGNISTIKEIRFVGNEAFSSKTLRAQMFHKTSSLMSWFDKSDHYSKEKLAADLEMLRSYYMDRGYLNFRIESTQVSLSVDKKYVYLTINVYEGQQFFFRNITLSGDMVVDQAQLQAIVDKYVKPGAVFSRRAIWEVKDALEERLGEDGYSKANIRIIDEIDQESRLVSMKFYIDANKRTMVRRISFVGNTLTEDKVLRRDLEQFEGSWISTKKIKESKEAIMRDGYSSAVDIETIPVVDKDDQVDLLYKLEEQRNAQISAGISYSDAESLSFNVGADLKNYLGTGKDLNFVFNHGKSVQLYSLGYNNPYFTDSGIGMGYNLYNRRTNLSKTSQVFNYALDETGLNIGWQLRLSQFGFFRFGGGFDHTVLKMDYNTAPLPAQVFSQAYNGHLSFKEYFMNFGWSHNSLDSFLFPSKGYVQSLDFKSSIPIGNLRVYRVDYDLNWFKPVYQQLVMNLKFDLGFQNVFNGKPFPFYKNYYLGGGETVRGYQERSLGPQTSNSLPWGGNFMVEGRVQVIFPPPFFKETKSVRTALFLDAGQVYDTHNKTKAQGMARNALGIRYSAGASLTWNTPMNIPVSFSYAWPLNKKYGDRVKRFAFSLGTQF